VDEIRIEIHPAILERFPSCRVGAFFAGGLRPVAERVQLEPADAMAAELTSQGVSLERLSEEPRIREWRKAYQQMGLKPSTFRSSAEQLARRLLKGSWISTPLPLVNLYSAVSVKHLAPLGAFDVERLPEATIALRPALESDVFHPLGARPEDMPLRPSVAVYAAGSEVLTWAINHRDSAKTCLLPETDLALFMGEAVAENQHGPLEAALIELRESLRSAGAAVGEIVYVDSAAPSASTRSPL
jgi:DNA/RNA-binding domain of Phe-tRNA-synthetase-like protein